MRQDELMVAFDLGTLQIRAAVAVPSPEPCGFEVLSVVEVTSRGIKNGYIDDMDLANEDVQKAIYDIERIGDCKLVNAFCAIGGGEIVGVSESYSIDIENDEISPEDVKRLHAIARDAQIPENHRVLHQFIQSYWIDGRYRMSQPVYSAGSTLELDQHIISAGVVPIENTCRCLTRAGLEAVDCIVVQPLASALSTLTPDECENGVIHINFGDGTTGLAIYEHGSIQYTLSMHNGFGEIVNDISIVLECSHEEASKILCDYGSAVREPSMSSQLFSVLKLDGTSEDVSVDKLALIIQCRLNDLFGYIKEELDEIDFPMPIRHFVITGGGSQLREIETAMKRFFKIPNMTIRVASPRYTGKMQDLLTEPRFSTLLGVFYEQVRQAREGRPRRQKNRTKSGLSRLKDWLLKVK